jgi:hypothetical protein
MRFEENSIDAGKATGFLLSRFNPNYAWFWKVKLNNFAASIQNFPDLWRLTSLIDQLLLDEFSASEMLTEKRQKYPRLLVTQSHVQIRFAKELAFSWALTEAGSLMRVAIEAAVTASKLFREPDLLEAWLDRENPGLKKIYYANFVAGRRKNFFEGLPELERLYPLWCDYSETSSHASLQDLGIRLEARNQHPSDTHESFEIHYFERNAQLAEMRIFQLAATMMLIEGLFFRMFSERLPTIEQQRREVSLLFESILKDQKRFPVLNKATE